MADAITEKFSQHQPQSLDQSRNDRAGRSLRRGWVVASVPGMQPRSPTRNLVLGAMCILVLGVLTSILATVRVSYRPYGGC